ncbi:TPA: XRE family transcriptional regulator [Acinetobacter baumannii]|uniref:XRE family transcriptional regulator n=1 Tax=Acinetobacter baumannii TaxID=470 RepID=UPI00040CC7A0|nr:XRE family transcriptional regulator [Acinetobacter baumannii]MCG9258751.1 XRE family transcriptional regulator [Acinetobacter baumannii]MCG9262448.1 XRE family transcriptional regulator [Acinetobacter baumannii]MCL6185169.1 XRE family transcriptional regulator [Acinetobacter baumannii]MCL6192079.1 XRE family transcriptional regulator [Acinetobacter baumannii]MDC4283352.1 XRE family transcriptional regulator [Acinetobacter baumannii]
MPYAEFQRLIGKAGLTIKEFAELLGMNPNSITNYHKVGVVPSHIAIIISLIATMRDQGLDFYEVFEKLKEYHSITNEGVIESE